MSRQKPVIASPVPDTSGLMSLRSSAASSHSLRVLIPGGSRGTCLPAGAARRSTDSADHPACHQGRRSRPGRLLLDDRRILESGSSLRVRWDPVSWRTPWAADQGSAGAAPSARHGRVVTELARVMPQATTSCPGAAARSSQRTRKTGSAGRAPEQLLDTPALALGRTARAAGPGQPTGTASWRGGGGGLFVDVARGGNRCADTFGDGPAGRSRRCSCPSAAQPHLVTGPYGMCGL